MFEGSAAVADGATSGAGVTPGESSTPTETPTASPYTESGGGLGEQSPKPSSEGGTQGGTNQEADDSKLPFNQHPRWKEVHAGYKEYESVKPVLEALHAKGIHSAEDADFLFTQANEAQAALQQFESSRRDDPESFLRDFNQSEPEAYLKTYNLINENGLLIKADRYERAGKTAEANFLRQLANEYRSNGSAPGVQQNPQQLQFEQERQDFYRERDSSLSQNLGAGVRETLDGRIENLTKGVKFASDDQRNHFYTTVYQTIRDATDNDQIFLRQLNEMWQAPNRHGDANWLSQMVKKHDSRAMSGGLLEKSVQKALNILSLSVGSAEGDRQARLNNATDRREAGGSGGAANGNLDAAAKRTWIDGLHKRYGYGTEFSAAVLRGND